jgi:hypothetical protein
MSHDPQQRPEQPESAAERGMSPTARRALFATGAAAGVGALGLLAAPSAQAAATPFYMSRLNYGRNTSTSIIANSSASLIVRNNGNTGQALVVTGEAACHGAVMRTVNPARWGSLSYNLAATTGGAGALFAQGGVNIGARIENRGDRVPALMVTANAEEVDVAILATGESYLDGDALALRSWVGVPTTVDGELGYAPLDSSLNGAHSASGKVTLDGSGQATVTFDPDYAVAIQREDLSATPPQADTLTVQLTAVGQAMASLYVASVTATGFTIAGGAADGIVFWQATADRLWLQFDDAASGSVAAAKPSLSAAKRAGRGRGTGTVRRRTEFAGGAS